ncbi:MAG: hypothetical protein M3O22_06465 [Pseudomonadota bacterium]|nr:hypothetical protein [Pseudomonadota bacterium]
MAVSPNYGRYNDERTSFVRQKLVDASLEQRTITDSIRAVGAKAIRAQLISEPPLRFSEKQIWDEVQLAEGQRKFLEQAMARYRHVLPANETAKTVMCGAVDLAAADLVREFLCAMIIHYRVGSPGVTEPHLPPFVPLSVREGNILGLTLPKAGAPVPAP